MKFKDPITTLEELRALMGEPSELARKKQIDHLDAHCREYIAHAPFLLIGTADAAGRCDVSPKGDAPGFVRVLDDRHLVIPDRPGNKRLDSVRNILENPHIGLIFLVPRYEETLRINGRATITRDPELTERLRKMRGLAGINASPDAAASLLRGLDTLDERIRQQTETATELARRLGEHSAVELVRYPGYSGVISFDVADPRTVETGTKLILNATSLGGVTSTMESRHRWEGDRIPRGLLRLSVGLEPVDELWADLEQALA
jgi:predicted pyridoxine 5'-phosphate oxidase superfamily flavin-nucleotide-binding protein